ncbi:MAG: ATP-binding protein [candidate division Zixibacteria bacterium]
MKVPGILYRISFLVLINSIFIFIAVAYVSIENNQAKIERLVSYRFDFISDYFRAELNEARLEDYPDSGISIIGKSHLGEIFEHSSKFMRGLGGLTLLEMNSNDVGYEISALRHRDELNGLDINLSKKIQDEIDRKSLIKSGIYIGPRYTSESGRIQTIYIPWVENNPDLILAITFMPEEFLGSDFEYNLTLVLLFLVITLISLLIVNLLFRDFIKPFQNLIRGMEKTAEGEVLYQMENVSDRQIGRVTIAFNTMSSSLWKQRKKLKKALVELTRANKSFEKSEAFLSKLITNSPFAIIATDADKKIKLFNQAAQEMFGFSRDNAIGQELLRFFPFAPDRVFPADTKETGLVKREMICQKEGGDNFPVLVNRVTIRGENSKSRAHLFIIRDISESKNFQEMMISIDRVATRGVMAGEIAHEINNYLAIILGNVELLPLLLSKGKMDKVEQKLGVLRNTVAKIQTFSEGLMGYGNDDAVFAVEDLNQLIENLIVFLKPQNRYDDISFDLNLSRELPLVEFDGSQIQQLMVNLLNNAADALREKEGEWIISISTDIDRENCTAKIKISDNAGGLPEDINEYIFEKRYTGKRRGRGFGLVIVKRIIDKHHGHITYHSQVGVGTSFTITLPLNKPETIEEIEPARELVTS